MNYQPHFRLPHAPWWACLALAVALPTRAEVTCSNQNPAVPASTPTADFTLHDNGTVTHVPTGLMWMRCSLGQTWTGFTCTNWRQNALTYTWRDALNAAQAVNASGGHAGHTDWRLPNKNELTSIIEERCWSPAINAAVFPGTRPDGMFLSSSSISYTSGLVWVVSFSRGNISSSYKSGDFNVRLVRAGQ